jgi:hypothetical protein
MIWLYCAMHGGDRKKNQAALSHFSRKGICSRGEGKLDVTPGVPGHAK